MNEPSDGAGGLEHEFVRTTVQSKNDSEFVLTINNVLQEEPDGSEAEVLEVQLIVQYNTIIA